MSLYSSNRFADSQSTPPVMPMIQSRRVIFSSGASLSVTSAFLPLRGALFLYTPRSNTGSSALPPRPTMPSSQSM